MILLNELPKCPKNTANYCFQFHHSCEAYNGRCSRCALCDYYYHEVYLYYVYDLLSQVQQQALIHVPRGS